MLLKVIRAAGLTIDHTHRGLNDRTLFSKTANKQLEKPRSNQVLQRRFRSKRLRQSLNVQFFPFGVVGDASRKGILRTPRSAVSSRNRVRRHLMRNAEYKNWRGIPKPRRC